MRVFDKKKGKNVKLGVIRLSNSFDSTPRKEEKTGF